MAVLFKFNTRANTATPTLNRLALGLSQTRQRGLVLAWAIRVRDEAKRIARGKGGSRFWAQLARTIHAVPRGTSAARVQVDHVAAAQKQFGGPITAKPGKALTIPLNDAAKRRRAREFRDLFILPGTNLLMRHVGPRGNGELVAMYLLVKRTRPQRPDPFMPNDTQIARLGEELAEAHLAKA